MATMNSDFPNPKAIAAAGEKIYESLRTDLENSQHGKFVAINVRTRGHHLGDTAEAALENAKKAEPAGLFHLIRVGFPGAFQISHAFQEPNPDWLSQ